MVCDLETFVKLAQTSITVEIQAEPHSKKKVPATSGSWHLFIEYLF
jgi:hypothetical protein